MKLLIRLLLIFPIYLFSAQNSSEVSISYKEGMKSYKANDFKNSYELFSKIYLEKLSDAKFNFYYGRSAYETGHYGTALAAFERVEMQDSANLRNRLEMGRTYYMLKMYEDSENAFKDVLANPDIPESVRRNIELSLSRVSKVQQKSFTYATAMMDILFDSNVRYTSIGGSDSLLGYIRGLPRYYDTALHMYANVVNIYDIGDKYGYALKNSFSFDLKDYRKENDYNTIYFAYSPSLIYTEARYTAELALGIDTQELGGKKFLTTLSLTPKLQYNHTATLSSLAHLQLKKKNFKSSLKDFNAKVFEISYGLQDILSPSSYIQANVAMHTERKTQGSNIYVAYNEYQLNTTYAKQINANYSLSMYGEIAKKQYADYSPTFGTTREDKSYYGSVGVTRKLLPSLRFKLGATYRYVNSNQDIFTYNKYTLTTGIVKTF